MKVKLKAARHLFTLLLSLIFSATVIHAQNSAALKLWYNKPSGKVWENALPIGNGRLGAMIYGNVEKETIQLNEHTLWSGSPNRNDNPLALDSLSEIRKLIMEEKQKQAEQLAKGYHQQKIAWTNFYYRERDIEKAVTKTSYPVSGVTYIREAIALLPDRSSHLTASKPNSISFTAFYTSPQPKFEVKTMQSRQIAFAGATKQYHQNLN